MTGAAQVQAHALVDLLQAGEGVLGVGELGPLLHQLGAKVGAEHALGLHHIPEAPLGLAGTDGKELFQPLDLHGVDVGLEGQGGHVGTHIVVGHHVLVQGLHFGLAPVHLRHFFQEWQVPAGKPNQPGVVDIGHGVSSRIRDRVGLRHRIAALKDHLHIRSHALPAVQDVQAPEGAGKHHVQVQGLFQVLLPLNHQQASRPAVQTPPPEPSVHPVPDAGLSLQLVQRVLHLRGNVAFELVPFPQHVVHHQADHILHHPVVPI